ncbi:hypothetical protein EYF80_017064 [Liparis tanakae]|uniref:Uncharacterized protein n=1 Tax=Liparis tanakae TaxID=230148 RepID=A0A4Z2I4N1_9TELE|nr:hypothetical protein EYF80_017064 [Liparis tanakae]
MVITLPGRSALWALRPRTSPLHALLLRLNGGPKRTPVHHLTSKAAGEDGVPEPDFRSKAIEARSLAPLIPLIRVTLRGPGLS